MSKELKSLFWATLNTIHEENTAAYNRFRGRLNALIDGTMAWSDGWDYLTLTPTDKTQRRIGESFIVDANGVTRARVKFTLNVADDRGSYGISHVFLTADFAMGKDNRISTGFAPDVHFEESNLQELAKVVFDGFREQVRQQAVERTPRS